MNKANYKLFKELEKENVNHNKIITVLTNIEENEGTHGISSPFTIPVNKDTTVQSNEMIMALEYWVQKNIREMERLYKD